MHRQTYMTLLSNARRLSRRTDEAEDLLQTVLLAALEAGRADISHPRNRRWLFGALRKRAAFDARSAVRRRAREHSYQETVEAADDATPAPHEFVSSLPAALRTTALLVLTGHTRPEIRHLLRLTDTALRQRIVQIRRRWHAFDSTSVPELHGLSGHLPFGLIRRALRPAFAYRHVHLGSHDPDGHLFVISHAHKTVPRGNA